MRRADRALVVAGVVMGAVSLLHLAIIAGGPVWYRAFGAGEDMARLAERGSPYPAVVTAVIATLLAVAALYAFSGAGVIRRLPLLRIALPVVAAVLLGRGLLGIPAALLMDAPYMHELRARMGLMTISSVVCIALGLCYAAGAASVWRRGAAA